MWYVYREDHHEGPFEPDQLKSMLAEGNITLKTLTWKEGMESWIVLEENAELAEVYEEDELPPPLPPLPMDDFEDEEPEIALNHINKIQETIEEEDKTEAIQIESQDEEQTAIVQLSDEDKTKDHGDFESYKTYRNSLNGRLNRIPWKRVGKWSLGIAALAVVAATLLWFFWDTGEAPSYTGLVQGDRDRLIKTSLGKETLELNLSFALSKDSRHLWMAVNRKAEAQVHLKMVALKGRVLASEKIVVSSKGEMKRGVTHFSRFKMEQGAALVPGAYSIEIFGNYTGLRNKGMLFLQRLGFLNFLYAIKDYSPKFKYKKDFLIISGKKADFQKELKSFLGRLHSKKIKPIQDMVERYRTYNALLERTFSIYKEKLKKYRTPYSIVKSFEKDYAKQVAPLLEFVLLDNNKIHVYLADSDAVIAGEYEMLLTFGKQVGELVSDMSTETKKYRKLSRGRRRKLREGFEHRVKKLEELSSSRLGKLESRLEHWKNSI